MISLLSFPGEEDYEEEELDEATRQFNFWTHQVHIFFVRKFFTAAQNHALVTARLHERLASEAMAAAAAEAMAAATTVDPASLDGHPSTQAGDEPASSPVSNEGEEGGLEVPSHGELGEQESVRTENWGPQLDSIRTSLGLKDSK